MNDEAATDSRRDDPIRVAVFGAGGAMGTAVCAAVEDADGLELAARVVRGDSLDVLTDTATDVAVDLTSVESVLANIDGCLTRGVHVVVGTSGFDEPRIESVRRMLTTADPRLGVLIAPNFSLGALFMMRFAREAAPHFASAEVIELHRATKPDAPSGTARHTAEQIATARRAAGIELPVAVTEPAARGDAIDGVHVHSVRLHGLLAHQEVLFGGTGEVLTIRHDSLDRSSFMPGVLLAVRAVRDRPGLTVGLDAVLWPDT